MHTEQGNLRHYQLVRDKKIKEVNKSLRYEDRVGHDSSNNLITFVFTMVDNLDESDPKSYYETMSYNDSNRWQESMKKEMESLKKN